ELVYVWSSSGATATVQRGMLGSIPAAHTSGAIVYVNPRWSNFTIFAALNEDLASLSAPTNGLYQMKTVDLTYSPAITGYDLTAVTDILSVYDVRTDTYGPAKDWPRLARNVLARNQNTGDFPSGFALQLFEGGYPGKTMRVQYRAPFAPFAALTDNLTVTGLPATAADLPPLGALWRLVAPREIKRSTTDSQPESRTATEVPPGTSRQTAAGLMSLRQLRIKEEAARLAQMYPPLSRRTA
ncbi:MAG TPA: hypothetical protein VLL25_10235, partial [Acidimicrobiales bacterium]|nr:hypothetical protein [Acidimicrobiales bacterium]